MTGRAPIAVRRVAVLAAVLALSPGCKSKEGGTASGGGTRPDPLVSGPGRIPRQNIPLPEKGGTAGGKRGDPLLGSPVARPGDRSGYTTDPDRWKNGPYVPGRDGTPAALANRTRDDGYGLKMEATGGTQLTPTSGATTAATDVPSGSAALYAELKRFKVDRGDYTVTRDGGRVLFQARVPVRDGVVRGYSGVGATEADALRHVLEQMRGDLGTR